MNCFNVTLQTIKGIRIVGVMCEKHRAASVAIKSLLEGQHLLGEVLSVEPSRGI